MSLRDRWRDRVTRPDRKAYLSGSTESIQRLRDHAAANGLNASRQHYDVILAYRARHARRPPVLRLRGRSR